MNFMGLASPIAASMILAAGVIDDFKTRKFHNWLFLTCAALALALNVFLGGLTGLTSGVLGFIGGFAFALPLVLLGILGAGDMKLLAAFGILVGWTTVASVLIYAMIWGAIFGVVRILITGQGRILVGNLKAIVKLEKREALTLHQIPFTIAILMGWLTQLVEQGRL